MPAGSVSAAGVRVATAARASRVPRTRTPSTRIRDWWGSSSRTATGCNRAAGERSIAVIDAAIAQSRAALARDSGSGFLATQLNRSLEKKVELLRLTAQLPART